MVAAAPPALPRLGDGSAIFAQRLGAPLLTEAADGYLIRRYRSALGPLTALFEHERSVALHLPFQTAAPHRADAEWLQALLRPSDGAPSALLVDDSGWVLAAQSSPFPVIEALLAFK